MAEIFFTAQNDGYDRAQVDNYIHRLTEAYQKAYNEYLATCDKYNALMQDYKKLEADKQVGMNANVIARTLMDSERLAQEIIDNAYNEEARIIEQTKNSIDYVYKTIEKAMTDVQKFLVIRSNTELGGNLNEFENAAQSESWVSNGNTDRLSG
ncbi:MAG: DivIVA domain-containing protein [Oscillospiraceae bacterium]|nr:DivIVA domain-containing protein [Oscillospiraceae bacterium]